MDTVASKEVVARAFITSDYILDETVTLIRFAHSHSKAVEFAKAATSSKATRVVYVGDENFARSPRTLL